MILVTGGKGVIGTALVRELKRRKYKCIVYDIVNGNDIRDYESLESVFKGNSINTVIHLAAVVSRKYGEEQPSETIETNVVGTHNVIKLCIKYNAKLLNTSTSEVYNLTNCYGISKLQAEQYVNHYAINYNLKAITVRPFMCYGVGERSNFYRSAIANFIYNILHDKEVYIHRGSKRSWCYIDDIVDGFILLTEKDGFNTYDTFDLGVNDLCSMSSVAKLICKLAGKPISLVKYGTMGKFQTLVKDGNFSKIQNLRFQAKVSLEEGLKRTIEWQRG